MGEWVFHDSESHSGWFVRRDDGAKLLHMRSRTDVDERLSAYLYANANVRFEFVVIERGDPKTIQPAEVEFIFQENNGSANADAVEAAIVLERCISTGRRDFALARQLVTIES